MENAKATTRTTPKHPPRDHAGFISKKTDEHWDYSEKSSAEPARRPFETRDAPADLRFFADASAAAVRASSILFFSAAAASGYLSKRRFTHGGKEPDSQAFEVTNDFLWPSGPGYCETQLP